MNYGDIDPKTFANNMFGPEDEQTAICIHCRTIGYKINHKDGVCPTCQEKGLPGRTEIQKREDAKMRTIGITLLVFFITLIIILFSGCRPNNSEYNGTGVVIALPVIVQKSSAETPYFNVVVQLTNGEKNVYATDINFSKGDTVYIAKQQIVGIIYKK